MKFPYQAKLLRGGECLAPRNETKLAGRSVSVHAHKHIYLCGEMESNPKLPHHFWLLLICYMLLSTVLSAIAQ